jgi:hypothetical protein
LRYRLEQHLASPSGRRSFREDGLGQRRRNGPPSGVPVESFPHPRSVQRVGNPRLENCLITYEFSYSPLYSENDRSYTTVAVTTNTYNSTVKHILDLEKRLRAEVPFTYRKENDPEVQLLGGMRRKGMISVEMKISVAFDEAVASKLLSKAKFSEGLEYTI